MKKRSLSLLLLLTTVFAFAQKPTGMPQGGGMPKGMTITGKIYGKIIDEATKKPVEFASVVALRALGRRDSMVGGMLTLQNGEFSVDGLPIGGIKIKISMVGCKDVIKQINLFPPDLEVDMGDVKLGVDTKLLNEVEITGQKTSMQLGLDKKIFNVDKNITTTGGTAEDVLKSVPSVTVDADGSAKLRNSSTTIYVDGRPTLMSINQIPADQIETVEVISNPSAKFEASTTGGIINIVLKKNKKPGYNGFVSLGVGTGDRYNGMLNLNVKEGRSNFTGFYSLMKTANPTEGYSYRTEFASPQYRYFNQNTATIFDNRFQIGRLAWDYTISNRNMLTLAGTYVNGTFNIRSDQNFAYLNASNVELLRGVFSQIPENEFKNYQAQATWKKTYPKKGKELITDFTYGFGGSKNDANWTRTGNTPDGKPVVGSPQKTLIAGDNAGQQVTFQMDYTNPINDSTKLEMGLRSFWNGRAQNYLVSLLDNPSNKYNQINSLSQKTDVTDMINAAYVTYGSKFSGIAYQVGLRFEQSKLVGKSLLENQQSFGYDYPKKASELFNALFPSVYLSKKLNKMEEVQANFSRKINRPNFMQLMPIIMGADAENVRVGNPALIPEFVNLAELNYNKMWKQNNWLASLYLRADENPITTVIERVDTISTLRRTTFINGKSSSRYGLDNTLKLGLIKDLELTTNINVFNIKIATQTLTNEAWAYTGKFNLNYKLPKKLKDFSLQLQGSYESDQIVPQGVRKGIAFADFAVKYTFLRVANVTLQVSDITNTRREILFLSDPTFSQTSMRRRDLRFVKLSFQMPFGKMDSSIFRKAKDAGKNRNNQDMQPDFGG